MLGPKYQAVDLSEAILEMASDRQSQRKLSIVLGMQRSEFSIVCADFQTLVTQLRVALSMTTLFFLSFCQVLSRLWQGLAASSMQLITATYECIVSLDKCPAWNILGFIAVQKY